MTAKHLTVPISLPYFTLNALTENTDYIWMVAHGYGQLAQYFIRKFDQLDPERHFIIAPQGLSKFYLEGELSGRVGASWMTKEDRLTEIDNQHRMIEAIWRKEVPDRKDRKLIFFGFSQGAATIVRYLASTREVPHALVLWAGSFPHDVTADNLAHLPAEMPVKYFTGKSDPFLNEEVYARQLQLVKDVMGRKPEVVVFDGGHTVIRELLPRVYQDL